MKERELGKFEYAVVEHPDLEWNVTQELEAFFNAKGEEGWELVHYGSRQLIFKRIKG